MANYYAELNEIADKIFRLYEARDPSFERRWVDKEQMVRWYNGEDRNQVREVHIDEEHVANIMYKILALGHADLAKPLLCYEEIINGKSVLHVANGNNTNAALLRSDKKGVISITGSEVLVIPNELLPKDPQSKSLVLDDLGVKVNVEKLVTKPMYPRDLRDMLKKHIKLGVDVDDPGYRKKTEENWNMTSTDVSLNVSKAKSELARSMTNELNKFHQYKKEDEHYFKKARTKEFDKQNRSVGVCWAVVDRCKKLPETLGKAMGLAINNSEIHIVFNFKDFEDVSYEAQVEKYIARFSKKYKVNFSYEFLPWKQGENEV